ncbi:MAG: Trm112 family protein [Pseudomonadota bacterium]
MPIPRELIEIVACPKCKGSLSLQSDESGFECRQCMLRYPIEDGIPNFIVEEAESLEPRSP